MEGKDTKSNKIILSTEVLLGTQADNRTFQTVTKQINIYNKCI